MLKFPPQGTKCSRDPQNPALDFSHLSFRFGQAWPEEPFQAAVPIILAEPFRGGVGILLMGVAAIAGEAVTPQRRINLNDCRLAGRHLPAIERPEMNRISKALTEK